MHSGTSRLYHHLCRYGLDLSFASIRAEDRKLVNKRRTVLGVANLLLSLNSTSSVSRARFFCRVVLRIPAVPAVGVCWSINGVAAKTCDILTSDAEGIGVDCVLGRSLSPEGATPNGFFLLRCGVAAGGRSVAIALISRMLVCISLSMDSFAIRAPYYFFVSNSLTCHVLC